MRYLYPLLSCILLSCSSLTRNDTNSEISNNSIDRITSLCDSLISYCHNHTFWDKENKIPNDLVLLTENLYWHLKSFDLKSNKITFDVLETEDSFVATFNSDYKIEVQASYDSMRDKYHLKIINIDPHPQDIRNEKWTNFIKTRGFNQKYEPGLGTCGYTLHKTTKQEIKNGEFTEEYLNDMGLFFNFDDSNRISEIFIYNLPQITDSKGLRIDDYGAEIQKRHGIPASQSTTFISDLPVGKIRSINYDGICYLLVGNHIKMVHIK